MKYNPLKDELKRLLNEKLEEYSRKLIKTPKVEWIKLCPFCLEIITVNNLGRDCCQEKNGKKDFSKKDSEVLNDKTTKQGLTIQRNDSSSPVKIVITSDLGKQSNHDKEAIDMSIRKTLLKRNIRILNALLYTEDIVSFNYDDLKLFRYAFDVFDCKIENEEQLTLYKVGRFALLLRKDEPCGLTLAKNLDDLI